MSQTKNNGRDLAVELHGKEFTKFVLQLENCDEAIECFPDCYICPVCLSMVNKEGILIHKPRDIYVN